MTPSPKLIGKYEILEELGRGGFATVYKARDIKLNRVVALKVLHPYRSAEPGFVERFRREAEVAANLDHPNIVAVYEADEADGQLYLAMKYVRGRTLRELLQAEGAQSLERALPILEQVASALDYAHGQNVVHRDIKPSNIIVEDTAQGPRVTVLDFGLVKALEGSTQLTREGTLLGSPEYMAPEQADPNRASEIGPATDRYALGIVAYQMLAGRVPFPGETPATLNAQLALTPPDPHALRSEVSPQVGAVLLKMLAKAPAGRYASAREFVTALRQAAAPPAIHPIPRRTSRWAWGALLGVLVVLAIGILLSVIRPLLVNQVLPTSLATPITLIITATVPPTWTHTPTPPPLLTETPVPTDTPSPTALPLPTLGAGSTRTRAADVMTMVYVPAGTFKMGSETGLVEEMPPHDVTLDAFWIDRTEVTNTQYARCVAAGKCDAPSDTKSATRQPYYGDSQYGDYPVVFVSWTDADKYCKWAGGQLPTEAQWEYAARGPDALIYPWGDTFDGTRLNFCDKNCPFDGADKSVDDGYADTAPVDEYPSGASWVGALNLAGNVWEWVHDWYGRYSAESQINPTGPDSDTSRVLRGGSWHAEASRTHTTYRNKSTPGSSDNLLGFRCVAEGPGK